MNEYTHEYRIQVTDHFLTLLRIIDLIEEKKND